MAKNSVPSDACKPFTWRTLTGRGWHGETLILCQHGHMYQVVKLNEWAGSRWESAIGKARATGRPLYEFYR